MTDHLKISMICYSNLWYGSSSSENGTVSDWLPVITDRDHFASLCFYKIARGQ